MRLARTLAALSRFHIVLVAAGGSLVFGWLLTDRFWPLVAALVAVDWFLVNLVNRVVDVAEDRVNRIAATDSAARHGRGLVVLAVAVLGASFAVHAVWLPALLPVRAAYHLLGLVYNVRLLPQGVSQGRRGCAVLTQSLCRGLPAAYPCAGRDPFWLPEAAAATMDPPASRAPSTPPPPVVLEREQPPALRAVSWFQTSRLPWLLPGPGRRRVRLKDRLWAKNAASDLGFLLTLFGYPLAALPLAPDATPLRIALLALAFAVFEYSFEVIYDLRDVPGDRAAGVRTWPVVRGPAWAARLVVGLNLVSVHVSLWGAAAGVLGLRDAVLAVGPLVQLALFLPAARRGVTARDCQRVTWAFVALLLGYCGWVLVGLPTALPGPLPPAAIAELGLAVVAVVLWRSLRRPDAGALSDRTFWALYAAIAAGAWLAEHSAIALYDFYHYAPTWTVFVGTVPLGVALIWPLVVLSAWDLLRRAGLRGGRLVAAGAALVLGEALFVEIVGVHAGLWAWAGHGPFDVPLVGLAGWAAFGAAALLAVERRGPWIMALPLFGPAAVHAVVVPLWHAGLKSLAGLVVPDPLALALVAALAAALALAAVTRRRRWAIPLAAVPYRLLAAELLYACLALAAPSQTAVAAALLLALPYLALFTWAWPAERSVPSAP